MEKAITRFLIGLMEKEAKKPGQEEAGLVKLSPVLLWVGLVCGGLFLIPGLLVPVLQGEYLPENWFFLAMAAACLAMVMAYFHCRIRYTDTEFTVRYFLGFRRTFRYEEIQAIRSRRGVTLRVRGRTVRIDELSVGTEEFLRLARKKYRTAHGGKPIPKAPAETWDPFNGHVDSPGEFLFLYALVEVLLIGTMIFGMASMEPWPEKELTFYEGPLQVLEENTFSALLLADSREIQVNDYLRSLMKQEAFFQACRQGQVFTLGYRPLTDEGEIIGYEAELIRDGAGKTWRTPKDGYHSDLVLLGGLLLGMQVLWLGIVALSIRIGRNPQKYPKRVIRWFFKDGYVH